MFTWCPNNGDECNKHIHPSPKYTRKYPPKQKQKLKGKGEIKCKKK